MAQKKACKIIDSFLDCDREEPLLDVFPVDDLPDLLDVVGSDVLVVNVVGVLPYVDGLGYNRILLKRGVRPWGASISWLGVSTILRDLEMLSQASHPQPEPWMGTVFLLI